MTLREFGKEGDGHVLCEAPFGPFRQEVAVTFCPPRIVKAHSGEQSLTEGLDLQLNKTLDQLRGTLWPTERLLGKHLLD